jgi:hypothetical protein
MAEADVKISPHILSILSSELTCGVIKIQGLLFIRVPCKKIKVVKEKNKIKILVLIIVIKSYRIEFSKKIQLTSLTKFVH